MHKSAHKNRIRWSYWIRPGQELPKVRSAPTNLRHSTPLPEIKDVSTKTRQRSLYQNANTRTEDKFYRAQYNAHSRHIASSSTASLGSGSIEARHDRSNLSFGTTQYSRPPPINAAGDKWAVERLLARRKIKGKTKYLYRVRWKGYPPESDQWEPRKNIDSHVWRDFDKNLRKKRAKRLRRETR